MMLSVTKLMLKQSFRYRGRIVSDIVNVILRGIILIFFAQAFASNKSTAKGFGLTAMILLMIVSEAMRGGANFFRSQEYYGTFYRIFATPANRVLLVLASSSASLIMIFVEIFPLLLIGYLLGYTIIPGILFRLTLFSARLSIFGFAMLISPVGIAVKNITGPLINIIQTLINLIAGVLIPLRILPHSLQELALLMPFTHAFEAFRGVTVYSRSTSKILIESLKAVIGGLIMLAMSSVIIKYAERRAMEYGYERL